MVENCALYFQAHNMFRRNVEPTASNMVELVSTKQSTLYAKVFIKVCVANLAFYNYYRFANI